MCKLTISVTGAVDVSIVPRVGFVLYVSRVDGDTTGLFFGGSVDLRVVGELCTSGQGEDLGDGGGQRRLAVVDVAYSAAE